MHELSIISGLIEAVRREQKKHRFRKLLAVEMACGTYSCISEESLQFYFDSAAKGTPFEGARVCMKRLRPQYRCGQCGHVFAPASKRIRCPRCKRPTQCTLWIQGDLKIEALEVE